MSIPARYSDGITSGMREGLLHVERDALVYSDAQGRLRFPYADVTVPSRIGHTPRQIECADGAIIEVDDNDALDAALGVAGVGDGGGFIHAVESHWRRVLMLLVAGVAIVWGLVVYGVPAAVDFTLPSVPRSVDRALGEQTLASLSAPPFNLGESQLDAATRERLLAAWRKHIEPQASHDVQVLFRHGGWIGANALALPGGFLIVTDELVELAEHDEEVLAALAHELGHEEKRHAMQAVLESLAVVAAGTLITGDIGSLAVAAPYALVNSRYSREKEVEADAWARDALLRAGIAPTRLGEMLVHLDQAQGADGEEGGDWSILMASHPATRDRVRAAAGEKAEKH